MATAAGCVGLVNGPRKWKTVGTPVPCVLRPRRIPGAKQIDARRSLRLVPLRCLLERSGLGRGGRAVACRAGTGGCGISPRLRGLVRAMRV